MGAPEIYDAAQDWLKAGPWSGALRRGVVALLIVGGGVLLAQALRVGLEPLRKRHLPAAPLIYVIEKVGGYGIMVVGAVAGISMLESTCRRWRCSRARPASGWAWGCRGW